jgi:hypothetical protein
LGTQLDISRKSHPRGWLVICFSACIIALFLKSPDAFLNPQFWAEDGTIFYAEQYGKLWPQLATPYAGYLHFTPRLFAWLLSPIPPLYLPISYNLCALVIDTLCITYAINCLSRLYGTVPTFVSFFLLPNIGDIFGTLTNVQWFMQFPLILMVTRPAALDEIKSGTHRFVLFAIILVASLTGPFCLVYAALLIAAFAIKFVLGRAKETHPLILKLKYACDMILKNVKPLAMAALLIGAAIQLRALANSAYRPDNLYLLTADELQHFGLPDYFSLYSYTVNHPFYWVHIAILGIFATISILMFILFLRDQDYISCVTVFMLATGALQPILAFKKQHAFHTLGSVSHYYYFFGVICFCSTAMLIDRFIPNRRKWAWFFLASALGCLLLWKPQYFSRPFLASMEWPKYADEISSSRGGDVVVPLNPGWRAVIPVGSKERVNP